jgi:hypothetical protein
MIQRWTLSTSSRRIATGGRAVLGASFLMCLTIAVPVQAQSAKFSGIRDAEPSKFFDAAKTKPDPLNANRLIVGFDTGLDPTAFTTAEFVAGGARRVAMDTLSFTVTAPAGFYVAKITYTQRGTGSTCRTCSSAGSAEWVVAGHPASLGVFSNNPALTATADLTGLKLVTVPVSITDSLFATTGSVSITGADIRVKLLPR